MNGGPSSIWQSDFRDQIGSNCAVADPVRAHPFTIYGTTSATPEPGSLALFGSGMTLVGTEIRRLFRTIR
jgi:PEP-CTERM motif-containing protein